MIQGFKWALPLAAGLLLAACGGNERQSKVESREEGHDHAAKEEQSAPQPSAGKVVLRDDGLNAVYQHYIHLTTALVNGDAAEARVAASAIEAGAKQLKSAAPLAASAAAITTEGDIEAQRGAYATLSKDMIALVKSSGLSSGELYVGFCPMALNDKGASWISAEKEIKNPYFGEKMLECGEVKDTLK